MASAAVVHIPLFYSSPEIGTLHIALYCRIDQSRWDLVRSVRRSYGRVLRTYILNLVVCTCGNVFTTPYYYYCDAKLRHLEHVCP